jgi:hypothetical protein
METKDFMEYSNYVILANSFYGGYKDYDYDYTQYTVIKGNNDIVSSYVNNNITVQAFDKLIRRRMGLTNKEIHLR